MSLGLPLGLSNQLSEPIIWHHLDIIDSTNAYLLDNQQTANQLVSADQQTAGRGRRQQKWVDEGKSALFSLSTAFDKGHDISAWPVQVALTLAETLNQLLAHYSNDEKPADVVNIKWPNDLYIKQHQRWGKCAGILVESAIGNNGKVVTGIGINLSPLHTEVNADYTTGFINLPIDKKDLIVILANRLFASWENLMACPTISTTSYQSLDLLYTRSLVTTDLHSGQKQIGIGAGINEQGHLLLQQGNNILTLTAQQRIRIKND